MNVFFANGSQKKSKKKNKREKSHEYCDIYTYITNKTRLPKLWQSDTEMFYNCVHCNVTMFVIMIYILYGEHDISWFMVYKNNIYALTSLFLSQSH